MKLCLCARVYPVVVALGETWWNCLKELYLVIKVWSKLQFLSCYPEKQKCQHHNGARWNLLRSAGFILLNITVTVTVFINKLQALLNVKPDLLFFKMPGVRMPSPLLYFSCFSVFQTTGKLFYPVRTIWSMITLDINILREVWISGIL